MTSSSALPIKAYKANRTQVLRTKPLEKLATKKSSVSATFEGELRLCKKQFDTKVLGTHNF